MDEISVIVRLLDEFSGNLSSMVTTAESALSRLEATANSSSSSLSEMGSAATESGQALSEAAKGAEELGSSTSAINSAPLSDVSGAANEASNALNDTSQSAENLSTSLTNVNANDLISASSSTRELGTELDKSAEAADKLADKTKEANDEVEKTGKDTVGLAAITAALSTLTAGMEMAAREATNLNATFQKMGSAKMPEPEVRSFVASLISARLPLEDVLAYLKVLKQSGLQSADSLRRGVYALNDLSLATGVNRDEVIRFTNSLIVMGVRLDEIPKHYNAIAYAQANIVGGFGTYIKWMEKFDASFKELGLTVDQTVVLIAAATKKFGGGRAAYTGMSRALKECNGDLSVLEQKLGLQPGLLSRASAMTSKYSGSIEKKSKIMKENVTIYERLQEGVEKLRIQFSWLIAPILSVGGLIGGLVSTYMAYQTYQSAVATAANTQTLAEIAKAKALFTSTVATEAQAGAETTKTAATVTSTLATVRNTVANQALILSTYGSAAALQTAVGAAMAHAGAVAVDTEAQNMGILASLRYTAALAWQRIVTAATTAYTYALAAAQWVWNAALAASPITWIVLAVAALAAALVYLYYNYQPVTDAVNKFAEGLKWVGSVIYGYLLGAFNALKGALSGVGSAIQGALGGALNWIMGGLKQLAGFIYYVFFSFKFVDDMASRFGFLGLAISFAINPIRTVIEYVKQLKIAWDSWSKTSEAQRVFAELGAAFNELKAAFGEVWAALQPVFKALGEAFNELKNALFPVQETSRAVQSTGKSASSASGPIQVFVEIIRAFAWILTNVVVPAIRILAEWIHYLVPVFQAIGFAISAVIQVMVFIGQVVWNVITFLTKFGQALQMLISGHITFSQFMSIVWNLFKATVGRILLEVVLAVGRFGAQLIGKAVAAALGFVNSFLSFIRSLPGRLWIMLLIVVQRIIAWANKLREIARQAASNFVSKLVSGITGLPGRVSKVMWDVVNAIKNKVNDAYNAAKEFGQNVWNGIKSALHIKSPSIIYKQIEADTALVNQRFRSMASSARSAASTYAKGIREGMDIAGTNVPIDSTLKSSPVAGAVDETRKAITDMHGVTRTGLTNIVNTWSGIKETTQKTRDSYNASVNITRNAMTTMSTTTKTTMTHIKTGFNSMKSEVVSAASRTKTGVTGHLNTLSSNIRRFYNLVMNPGAGGPAGPGPSRRVFTTPSLTRLGAGGPPRAMTPTPPLTGPEAYTARGARRLQKIAEEYYKMLSCPSCYGAGWDYSTRMTGWVNRTVDRYRVGWLPGITLKAGDFSTYPPRGLAGNLARFIPFISSVIGRTHYRFYYGDSGLSPAELLRVGSFNCYDGARLVVAFARAFGLPASIRCGLSWGGIPHCAANVAGMWFDTTAFQQGYGWTSPRVTGYGGPTSPDIGVGPARIEHHAGDVHINVEVNGAAGLDEKELAKRIMEAVTDNRTIKRLTSHPVFLRRFDEEYGRYAVNDARRTGSR